MAIESQNDIFQAIRRQVGKTLEMAEADSKISDETKELLSHLILTRRGDGEIVLDMSGYQRLKATENQWIDKDRAEQERFINPTRLPQIIPGLQGLTSAQYLAFVQRPLERNGDNGPFLQAQTMRFYDQYHDKSQAAERNRLFGHSQRYVAKLLIDELLAELNNTADQAEIDKLRNEMPAPEQFALAAKKLAIAEAQVMNRLFKYGIALSIIERIKARAIQIKKAQPKFELVLRRLANTDSGPTAKTRIKEIFLGFQKDLGDMARQINQINQSLQPFSSKLHRDTFEKEFANLHRQAAVLDALVSRWQIIMVEANSNNNATSVVEKIRGLHTVFTN